MDSEFVAAIKLISNILSGFSRGLGFLIIVFLTRQYFKSKSNYKSAYYVILNVGYASDCILFINWAIPFDINVYYFTLVILEWHSTYFITIWNVVLCLNRCTALVFPTKYEKIWTPFLMFFVIAFMFAFSFIIDGYTLFQANCSVKNFSNCLNLRKAYFFKGTIVNGICNAIVITLIAISMYRSRNDQSHTRSLHAKIERRLIYQAIFSSIVQLFYFILKFFSSVQENMVYFLGFMYLSNSGYHIHHLIVMIIHFILSPTFKMAFLNFYHATSVFKSLKTTSMVSTVSKPTKFSSYPSSKVTTMTAIH